MLIPFLPAKISVTAALAQFFPTACLFCNIISNIRFGTFWTLWFFSNWKKYYRNFHPKKKMHLNRINTAMKQKAAKKNEEKEVRCLKVSIVRNYRHEWPLDNPIVYPGLNGRRNPTHRNSDVSLNSITSMYNEKYTPGYSRSCVLYTRENIVIHTSVFSYSNCLSSFIYKWTSKSQKGVEFPRTKSIFGMSNIPCTEFWSDLDSWERMKMVKYTQVTKKSIIYDIMNYNDQLRAYMKILKRLYATFILMHQKTITVIKNE